MNVYIVIYIFFVKKLCFDILFSIGIIIVTIATSISKYVTELTKRPAVQSSHFVF